MDRTSLPALMALHRFGLGARPGEWASAVRDPRKYVRAQLEAPRAALLDEGLPASDAALRSLSLAELAREQERARQPAPSASSPGGMAMAAAPQGPTVEQAMFRAEAAARFTRWARTSTPLLERLVLFWSNHFAVSAAKDNHLRVLAGAFEREAIRPHVLGRFSEMLRAVETHPAMLIYLDNQLSMGPNSKFGRNRGRGLNENLAREILELHTLGVDGGYAQADVTSFARIITGWVVTPAEDDALGGGRFTFAPARHEPGAHPVLGRSYEEAGLSQGLAVLDDLARHPATARFIATKLARHFVADDPPPSLVARLESTFIETQGDLAAVTRALVEAPEAWSAPPAKLRTPVEWLAAVLRATGWAAEAPMLLNALVALGQPLWQPPGPNGWPDRADPWLSPEAIEARLDMAAHGARLNGGLDPAEIASATLGPALSSATRAAMQRAESRQQALAILLMAPEFLRR